MTPIILHGDARVRLKELPGESIHCAVTSPPYWGLRCYPIPPLVWGGDPACAHEWGEEGVRHKGGPQGEGGARSGRDTSGQDAAQRIPTGQFCAKCRAWRGQLGLEPTPELWVDHLMEIFAEVWRVLRPEGTCWVNLGDCYATNAGVIGLKPKDLAGCPWMFAFAARKAGWYLRSEIIWAKANPMPEPVRDRPTKSHESIFLLAKSQHYFYDERAIREHVNGGAHARGNGVNPKCKVPDNWDTSTGEGGHGSIKLPRSKQNASFSAAVKGLVTMRNKRSVWTVPTEAFPEAHFATFPKALIRPCILAGCPAGGTVLDFFAGSGTTGEVCVDLGRKSILIELSEQYIPMIEKRCHPALDLIHKP